MATNTTDPDALMDTLMQSWPGRLRDRDRARQVIEQAAPRGMTPDDVIGCVERALLSAPGQVGRTSSTPAPVVEKYMLGLLKHARRGAA